MARAQRFSKDDVQMIKSLLDSGSSATEIAAARGVHVSRIYRIAKMKVKPVKAAPVKRQEDMTNEEVVERAAVLYTELTDLKNLMAIRHEEAVAEAEHIKESMKLLTPELSKIATFE